jgi:hypothetical protein
MYERDSFFLTKVLSDVDKSNKLIVGLILSIDSECNVAKVWISSWKRCIRWNYKGLLDPETIQPGSRIQLQYFINPSIRSWKEKLVYSINTTLN